MVKGAATYNRTWWWFCLGEKDEAAGRAMALFGGRGGRVWPAKAAGGYLLVFYVIVV